MKSSWGKAYNKANKDGALYILFTILIFALMIFTYSKTVYYIYYSSECEECIEYKIHDNGRHDKYHRRWEECVKRKYYPCLDHTIHFTFKQHQDSIEGKNGIVRVYE